MMGHSCASVPNDFIIIMRPVRGYGVKYSAAIDDHSHHSSIVHHDVMLFV